MSESPNSKKQFAGLRLRDRDAYHSQLQSVLSDRSLNDRAFGSNSSTILKGQLL